MPFYSNDSLISGSIKFIQIIHHKSLFLAEIWSNAILLRQYSLFLNIMCISSFHLSNPREIMPRISHKLCKS